MLGDQADALSAKAKAEKLAAKEAAEAASAEMSAVDRLREALRANLERVTDLFHTLDENLNGMISKREFRRVIPQLGLNLSAATADELFDTFDVDGYLDALQRVRRREHDVLAPRFHREIEEPVAGAIRISVDTELVITEGNYLLLPMGRWAEVAALLIAGP